MWSRADWEKPKHQHSLPLVGPVQESSKTEEQGRRNPESLPWRPGQKKRIPHPRTWYERIHTTKRGGRPTLSRGKGQSEVSGLRQSHTPQMSAGAQTETQTNSEALEQSPRQGDDVQEDP